MTVGVVDYDAGNLTSVQTALKHIGCDFTLSASPEQLYRCDRLVFPGVGDAASAMEVLRARGLDQMMRDFAGAGKPVLGICLGAQIVLDASDESSAKCLGLIPGRARRFASGPGVKVPHMGWNTVELLQPHPLFRGIPEKASFYFVHSYYPAPIDNDHVVARCEYAGVRFAAALSRANIVAVQFHPEKSGRSGLAMLSNFVFWE